MSLASLGELRSPPPAKFYDPVIPSEKEIAVVVKDAFHPEVENHSCSFCGYFLWVLLLISVFVLWNASYWPFLRREEVVKSTGNGEPENQLLHVAVISSDDFPMDPIDAQMLQGLQLGANGRFHRVIDPLEDLQLMFQSRAVELQAGSFCGACFMNDSTRVRRATVSSSEESFMIYRLEPTFVQFQLFSHIFQPESCESARAPFRFFTSDSLEEPLWSHTEVKYIRRNSQQGWESGVFTAAAPTAKLLKVSLQDVGPSTWRPQIGEVHLIHVDEVPESQTAPLKNEV